MENKFNQKTIEVMYWTLRVGFVLQCILVSVMLIFDYFYYRPNTGLAFTVRGKFYLKEQIWKPTNDFNIISNESVEPTVLLSKSGFVRFDYSEISEGLTLINVIITILDMLLWILSLFFTFQIFQIFKSIKFEKIFVFHNIYRLKLIAFIIGIIPIISHVKSAFFSKIVSKTIAFSNYTVSSPNDFKYILKIFFSPDVLLGLFVMVLILILGNIFRYGMLLKNENDLTI